MTEIPESLRSLFTARVEEEGGRYLIEVPKNEVANGEIDPAEPQRVAVLEHTDSGTSSEESTSRQEQQREPAENEEYDGPPVEEGEYRQVTIDDLGEQGDGITRVERGYVVIVPDTKPDDIVEIEIDNVRENVAFASVVERIGPKKAR
jgi:predicted RNA-binding protein with TRAM domain